MKIISIDPGIKHLSICIFNTKTKNIELWEVVNLNEKLQNDNKKQIDYIKLSLVLKNYLDKLKTKYFQKKDNIVLIENQPSYINAKIKSVQIIIFSYFIFDTCLTNIKFKNPFKIKIFESIIKKYKLQNLKRKELVIFLTKYYLNKIKKTNSKLSLNYFNKQKKKDDLADCFLQAYIYNDNIL